MISDFSYFKLPIKIPFNLGVILYEEELKIVVENEIQESEPLIFSMNGYLTMNETILCSQKSTADPSFELKQLLKVVLPIGHPAGTTVARICTVDFGLPFENKFALVLNDT